MILADTGLQKKVMYINNRIEKKIDVKKFEKTSSVVSGSLDYKNKDIESILKWFSRLLQKDKKYEDQINLILLWQINDKVENWIDRYKLTNIVTTFDHYVGEKDMETYMSRSHYAIISSYPDSIYGKYKISGAFGDAIWFNLPVILSENYAPDYKSENVIRFKNDSLDALLETLIVK